MPDELKPLGVHGGAWVHNACVQASFFDALASTGKGPLHGVETEDLNLTVLAWPSGHEVAAHINEEVDVVTIVVSGRGEAAVDGEIHALTTGSVLVIPKGVERSLRSLADDFRCVNVHKRRRKLMPQPGGRR